MRRVTMRFRSILPLILLFVAGEAAAQDNDLPLTPRGYGNRAGVQVLLTNHGFALGGYYTRAVSDAVSLVFDANIGSDRKSTRLNSSHVAISYAVFCLKKKP